MNPASELTQKATLSDFLAAERTFLAWIRTGLALMGFGFVVARFGLFLQQLEALQHGAPDPSYGLSLWFGTALIGVGVLVNLFSAWHHFHLVRQLNQGGPVPSRPSTQAVAIALFLALVGLAMAIYLVLIHSSVGKHPATQQEVSMTADKSVTPPGNKGIVDKPSNHSVDQTVERLEGILQSKGITLFALIDHSGEAEKVGMKMLPTKLLIFGNPKGGTPLMLATPSVAIDLPLKILVWEDKQGKVWVSYNSSAYLQERHGFPSDLLANIAVVDALASKAAE
jgi:uncharacterized protein (DUF302 family)/uncharacterized membrane protein YidH (DUF202 family)